ncbi:MAG: FliH/SctL family protein [Pirellula sp.]|jgi:flagellar assembly protein FliH
MASVFKSRALPPGVNTAQTEVFNWEDVASRAKQYIDTVREQAQQILRDSQVEADRMKAAAHDEGIRGGESHVERLAMQMASQIAEKRVQDAANSVRILCEDLEVATQGWLRQWQHETITLSIAIAEKLLARQIESDPTILIEWIEDSVRMVQSQRHIQLRIHPEDAQRLSSALTDLVEDMKPSMEIQVTEDVSVGRFGVILQTADSTIDRSMQTQLKRLTEELL